MPATLIAVIVVLLLLALGLAVCISCDSVERRWRLKRFRRSMLSQPDIADDRFSSSLAEIQPSHALEMRRALAELLGIDALKIGPEWRFREERHLRNLDMFIFDALALRYAPEKYRDHCSFSFPTSDVSTIRDLFLEVWRLEKNG
jgi:hypothetical protein